MSSLLKVGKIANTHGLKGEVKIFPYLNVKEDFEDFGELFFEGVDKKFKVEKIRYFKNMVIVKFVDYNNINEIEKYKGKLVYVDREELNDDVIYVDDLIGMTVIDENLGEIGVLTDFITKPKQDLLVVNSEKFSKEILIPDVDEFVKNIDTEENIITVCLIEGMV